MPYEAKNGLLDSIDEIGLVCGFRQLRRTTIERLTRHLTAYKLETNINTASRPVLYAFCTAEDDEEDEPESESIFELLHYKADDEIVNIIKKDSEYNDLLIDVTDSDLIKYLVDYSAFESTHFQVGIYGLVFNTETGTVLARARLRMDLLRERGKDIEVLYYRED